VSPFDHAKKAHCVCCLSSELDSDGTVGALPPLECVPSSPTKTRPGDAVAIQFVPSQLYVASMKITAPPPSTAACETFESHATSVKAYGSSIGILRLGAAVLWLFWSVHARHARNGRNAGG